MEHIQITRELNTSYQNIISDLLIDIESDHTLLDTIYTKLQQWLVDYSNGVYPNYQSKTDRLQVVSNNLDDLCSRVILATLILKRNSIQAYSMFIASKLFDDNEKIAKTGSEITFLLDGILYDIVEPTGYKEMYFVSPKIEVSDDILTRLLECEYPLPMVSSPVRWSKSTQGGFITHKYPIISGKNNKHNLPLNYNAINIAQEVSYRLNKYAITLDEGKDEIQDKSTRRAINELKHYKFYFPFFYDKRGRMYTEGYQLNVQGSEYKKSLLEFSEEYELTDRGWYWLKVNLANHFGKDKLSFDDRVKFIDDNIDDMLSNTNEWIDKAESPYLFRASLFSYRDSLKTNKSREIVRLDSTCSGYQLASVIARDEKAMRLLNVLGEERSDFYTEVTDLMVKLSNTSNPLDMLNNFDNSMSFRSYVKSSIMTSLYNSEAKPKETFKGEFLEYYYLALDTLAKGARELQSDINEFFDPNRLYTIWTLPDGHTSYCPNEVQKKFVSEVYEGNKKHYITFITDVVKPSKDTWRSLSPNVIHSIDAWVCRKIITTMNLLNSKVSPIHDSFGVTANDCDKLRMVYRQLLADLYEKDIVSNILSEIAGEKIEYIRPELNKDILQEIRTNEKGYYIC